MYTVIINTLETIVDTSIPAGFKTIVLLHIVQTTCVDHQGVKLILECWNVFAYVRNSNLRLGNSMKV